PPTQISTPSLHDALPISIARGLACVVDNDPINRWTPLTSMFLHGGWTHILGNALFFWVFGNNIEDSMGPGRFLAFYLICGLAARSEEHTSELQSRGHLVC